MSPHGSGRAAVTRRFPRVSGDEPHLRETFEANRLFSPRERG